MWIDSHIHLADERYQEDLDAVLARSRQAGIEGLVVIACEDKEVDAALRLADEHSEIRLVLGFHPHVAQQATEASWNRLSDLLKHPSVVGIGEAGLDYHYMLSAQECQREVFRRQIQLARDLNMPLIVHTREAEEDTRAILEENPVSKILIHCFPGTPGILGCAERLGAYLGVNGILTFKNADTLRSMLKTWPLERMVLETDGPYLSPIPHRGQRNEPAYIPIVGQHLAWLKEVPKETVASVTTQACRSLLSWPAPEPATG